MSKSELRDRKRIYAFVAFSDGILYTNEIVNSLIAGHKLCGKIENKQWIEWRPFTSLLVPSFTAWQPQLHNSYLLLLLRSSGWKREILKIQEKKE